MRAETKRALTMPNRRTSERNIKLVPQVLTSEKEEDKVSAAEGRAKLNELKDVGNLAK